MEDECDEMLVDMMSVCQYTSLGHEIMVLDSKHWLIYVSVLWPCKWKQYDKNISGRWHGWKSIQALYIPCWHINYIYIVFTVWLLIFFFFPYYLCTPELEKLLKNRASLVTQLVKNPPSMQETWVGSSLWR